MNFTIDVTMLREDLVEQGQALGGHPMPGAAQIGQELFFLTVRGHRFSLAFSRLRLIATRSQYAQEILGRSSPICQTEPSED